MCESERKPVFFWFHQMAYVISTWGYTGLALGSFLRWCQWQLFSHRKVSKDMGAGTIGSAVAMGMLFMMEWTTTSLIMANICITLIGVLTMPYAVQLINHRLAEDGEQSIGHDGTIRDYDHRRIVVDEVHGMWLAVLPVYIFDMAWWGSQAWPIVVAFALFRLFDITKWPRFIKTADQWFEGRGGFLEAIGVMLDDTLAGICATLCVWGIHMYYMEWLPT